MSKNTHCVLTVCDGLKKAITRLVTDFQHKPDPQRGEVCCRNAKHWLAASHGSWLRALECQTWFAHVIDTTEENLPSLPVVSVPEERLK